MDFIYNNLAYLCVSAGFVLVGVLYFIISKIIKWIFSDCVTYYDYPDECNVYYYKKIGKYNIVYTSKESVEKILKYLDFYEKRKKFFSFIGK